MSTRSRWIVWSVFAIAWTGALLYPVIHETGVRQVDEFISPRRFLIAKSVHVTAYAIFTLLTAWLQAPPRFRAVLMFFLMAHGAATELGQLGMAELEWSVRTGALHDVGFDNLGVLAGLLLGWKWWTRDK